MFLVARQVLFWLHFLKVRMAPLLPVADGGAQPWPAKVLLVATHADVVNCGKSNRGEYSSKQADVILARAQQLFKPDFDIHKRVFVVDAHLAMSSEFKSLRGHLSDLKERITRVRTD